MKICVFNDTSKLIDVQDVAFATLVDGKVPASQLPALSSGGYIEIDLSGGNHTITADEAAHSLIRFVGTITGDVTVTFPASVIATWYVQDWTSGGAVILTTDAAGANSLTIADPFELFVYNDGTSDNAGIWENKIPTTPNLTVSGLGGISLMGIKWLQFSTTIESSGDGSAYIHVGPVAAPSAATDSGQLGQWAHDGDYIYVCVADNTWKRAALASW